MGLNCDPRITGGRLEVDKVRKMRLIWVDELNAASPLGVLRAEPMAVGDFFVRSMFGAPDPGTTPWTVSVSGRVENPQSISIDDLKALGETTQVVTIECAGNGRQLMDPLPEGVPWGLGAASVGEFTGVPLRRVFDLVDPSDDVVEFVFTGADRGTIDAGGELNYAFSLHADVALGDGPALVWGLNGESLAVEHGGPLRLLVPGHYGMTSVKWLTEIAAIDEPYDGYFKERYRFFDHPGMPDGSRVDRIWVRSLITTPDDGSEAGKDLKLTGVAWSGHGPIASVAVKIDSTEWFQAELGRQESEYGPVEWSSQATLMPGEHSIAARATDEAGNTQPMTPPWNQRGFANNAVHRIQVTIT